ncbi:MAG TPA: acyl carrier protein [Chromatiales bacterium]|nr:acyl carrier protein [Chromatiales bacterium]
MKQYEEILDALYEVLKPFASEANKQLDEETQLVADLDIDSVRLLELLMEIEDHLDISIPLNRLPDINTVRDLAVSLQELSE